MILAPAHAAHPETTLLEGMLPRMKVCFGRTTERNALPGFLPIAIFPQRWLATVRFINLVCH